METPPIEIHIELGVFTASLVFVERAVRNELFGLATCIYLAGLKKYVMEGK